MDVVVLSLDECPRTPVLALRDLLGGAELATARSDADIDAVLDRGGRLVVAITADGQLRAVVRRLVRRYLSGSAGSAGSAAGSASARSADLPADRTVADLPPLGILPLAPSGLVTQLGLPSSPDGVAAAVLDGAVRRLDLLRTDSGSVTLDGALLGAADSNGRAMPWHGRVEVDDAILTDGSDLLLACAIANGTGYSTVDSLPLAPRADASDGVLDVAVAVPMPVPVRAGVLGRFGRRRVEVEVRRARGRAVSVVPRDGPVPLIDDGVSSTLDRRRSWWIERGAWGVYSS